MLPITIGLTKHDIEEIDEEVSRLKKVDDLSNRSKVIRLAVRKQLGITGE